MKIVSVAALLAMAIADPRSTKDMALTGSNAANVVASADLTHVASDPGATTHNWRNPGDHTNSDVDSNGDGTSPGAYVSARPTGTVPYVSSSNPGQGFQDLGGSTTTTAAASSGPWSEQGSGNGVHEVEFVKHESAIPAHYTTASGMEIRKAQCARMCSVNEDCKAFMWQKQILNLGNCYFATDPTLQTGVAYSAYKTFVKALSPNPTGTTHASGSLNAADTKLFDAPVRPVSACAYTQCTFANGLIEIQHSHLENNGAAIHNCRYDHITQICGCTCAEDTNPAHQQPDNSVGATVTRTYSPKHPDVGSGSLTRQSASSAVQDPYTTGN